MRRIGRRGLKQVSAIGLYGMISAVALAASAQMALAQPADNTAPTAIEQAPNTVPSQTEVEAQAPVAARPESIASPAAQAGPAAAAPSPSAALSQGVRSGGGVVRPGQTRYSKRQKGMGAESASTQPATPNAPGEVLCRAGCDVSPGTVVYAPTLLSPAAGAAVADADDDDEPSSKAQAQAIQPEPVLACVAGCFGSPATFAGVPNATEGGYALTKSKLSAGHPTSGEWLVRINRERAK